MSKTMKTIFRILLALLVLGLAVKLVLWRMHGDDYQSMHERHHGKDDGHGMMHGMGGRVDTAELKGTDTTGEEEHELFLMFMHFDEITRSVENLPDGIRTVTETENDHFRGFLVSHVVGMIARVDEGRDPEVVIQSPTLDLIFARADEIETEIEMTDKGVMVTQRSDDPALVEALQTHAAEVSDMADRGIKAVHERMGE